MKKTQYKHTDIATQIKTLNVQHDGTHLLQETT